MPEFMTTRELAELLRIKERKVYDLAAAGEVPCVRVTGKLLFPDREIRRWLAQDATRRPATLLGSHDPLLEWAVRESRCGLALQLDGSLDGLGRFEVGEGPVCGLHLFDAEANDWNVTEVSRRCAGQDVVLVSFATRRRGLIVAADSVIDGLGALVGRCLVPRQSESGTHALFRHLLHESNVAHADIERTAAVRSERDASLAVLHGHADAAFGLEALARQHRLGFVPLLDERFDLLIERRAWFEPPLQALLAFCRSSRFAEHANELGGYTIDALGEVRWNA